MNFRTKEQILSEQPSIERRIDFKDNIYRLTNTEHDVERGEYKNLTCYTYTSDENNLKLMLYVHLGKIVYVETE